MLALLLIVSQVTPNPVDLKIKVGDAERSAIVYRSNSTKPAPVVFVFHGFTGNAKHAAAAYKLHEAWPEATVVYPQGLEVELLGRKAPGWQIAPKMQDDRDVKFFDALLSRVNKDQNANPKQVFTCGMSNGAIFSYVLLAERSGDLAGAAPVAGYAAPAFRNAPARPILIIHGKGDTLLPISLAERSFELAKTNNGVTEKGIEWIPGYTIYQGSKGNSVIYHEHPGGHIWPNDATSSIVKFFKRLTGSE
jgi:polyhydroxybutyrate depolymerase